MTVEIISGVILAILAILAWRFSEKNHFKALKYVHLSYVVFAIFAASVLSHKGGAEHHFLVLLGGFLLLHAIVAALWKTKNDWLIFGAIALTGTALNFIPEGHIHFQEYEVSSSSPHAIVSLLMGALMLPLIQGLEKSVGKFFKLDFKSQRGISRAVYFIYMGIALLMCGFFLSLGGWVFFLVGFMAMMLYSKRSGAMWNLLLAVTVPTIALAYMQMTDVDLVALSTAKVLTGILAAGFVALFTNTLTRARKNKQLASAVGVILAVLSVVVLLFGQQINVQFGGYDAFVGLLFGYMLTALYGINIKKNVVLWALYFGLGLIYLGLMPQPEEVEGSSVIPTEIQNEKLEAQKLDVDATIDLKGNTNITFELGQPGARTNGKFKEVDGTLTINNGVMSAKVELPVSALTTFNPYRDESLMDETYFHQEKFPLMTYTASEVATDGNAHILKGSFKMLGTEKEEEVRMEYFGEVDGKLIFKGTGQIDRTEYGMKPDPKEGNVVDFTVEIAYPQK